ncbi:LysM peptidoglycan-binding domain-containing protein [Enterococcus gallinarum]|nr:LysM peptidoglycan-binding domain-containing protein [Enterococcus gallinarum]
MKSIKTFVLTTATIAGFAALSTTANADEIKHVVKSDDTLSGLSLKYFGNLDHIDQIAKDNKLKDPNIIYDGTTLIIDTDKKVSSDNQASEQPAKKQHKQKTNLPTKTNLNLQQAAILEQR